MATLRRELRSALERAVLTARRHAEEGARKALEQLAVAHHEPWDTMTSDQQRLRRRLRARGRQLGDRLEDGGTQGVGHLVSECAYEQWHRMLFARFLAECGLLIEPDSGVPLSVDECKELARERGADWISLASTFAQGMLPQIFRPDDPLLDMALPPEDRQPLEQLLISLPSEMFLADDSLGWVYQFWQSDAKDAINKAGGKIGADQLPAVTQLFTEDYMVEFLLHNTLGAWWAGNLGAISAGTEEEARAAAALPTKDGLGITWTYLRFIHDEQTNTWSPAAGTFSGWPREANKIKFLDPCMGSGHFIVFALPLLARIRMEERTLSTAQAILATLRDNLFGLELDNRCAQIAAFNVALAAWKLGGYQPLPPLHIACSGLAPRASERDWVSLAGADDRLKLGMARLYALFKDAPVLGSLINPRAVSGDLVEADFHELQPVLERALAREAKDDAKIEMAVTARGMAKAAELLAGQFTLVATNVPYLTRGKQCDELGTWTDSYADDAKLDLATIFTIRCLDFLAERATTALVVPQNWLALKSFSKLRRRLLSDFEWRMLVKLGPAAFSDMNWWAANTALLVFAKRRPSPTSIIAGLDASVPRRIHQKELLLQGGSIDLGDGAVENRREDGGVDDYAADEHFGSFAQKADGRVHCVNQLQQMRNHGAIVVFEATPGMSELAEFATVHYGFKPGQTIRVTRYFWEQEEVAGTHWQLMESTPGYGPDYSGKSEVCMRPDQMRQQGITEFGESGVDAWSRKGIVVAKMGRLPHSIYCGELFDDNTYVLLPKRAADLGAIWTFITSGEFFREVRARNQKVAVDTGSMVHISFDLPHWQKIAAEKYPDGLPKPSSSDPTQWLFDGQPKGSDYPLHVAVARLLGYQWPRQTGSSFPDCPALEPDGLESFSAEDGIVCISSVKGEESAVARLGALLSRAYGSEWNADKMGELVGKQGYAGETLEAWLRDGFFAQHCELFHHRPFLWHIWDGRKDGFSALANFHKLTKPNLEKLTYAYLGDWIRRQEASVEAGEAGSDARFVAARQLQDQLKKILEGEPPHDIFIRWKPLSHQPIGWEPDLNDGVRLNIRPFLMATDVGKKGAGVLRVKPKIGWDKDRGIETVAVKEQFPWLWGWDGRSKDFAGTATLDGIRWNDLHYSREFKAAARREKGLP